MKAHVIHPFSKLLILHEAANGLEHALGESLGTQDTRLYYVRATYMLL